MNHSDAVNLIIAFGVPIGGFIARWLFVRSRPTPQPSLFSRLYAWGCRVASANKRLADLQANLDRDERAAATELSGLRQDVDRVAADSTRLRAELAARQAENAELRAELTRLRGPGTP